MTAAEPSRRSTCPTATYALPPVERPRPSLLSARGRPGGRHHGLVTVSLDLRPVADHLDLVAPAVAEAVRALPPDLAREVLVAPIDPDLADTASFCAAYGVGLDRSANCVVVAGRRGGEERYAACLVLATQRADVNGVVRRHLDVRK